MFGCCIGVFPEMMVRNYKCRIDICVLLGIFMNCHICLEDPRIAAMADMVERIKKGVKLRSVASV